MSNSTNRVQEELSNTLTSAEENQDKPQSSELVTREKVDGTPFYIVGNDDHGYFLAFGIHRLSEPKPTIKEAKDYLKKNHWMVNMNFIITLYQLLGKEEKQQANGN